KFIYKPIFIFLVFPSAIKCFIQEIIYRIAPFRIKMYFCKKDLEMATNRTITMIKPDAVSNGHIGAILNDITRAGFRIVALKYTRLTEENAGAFYAVHKERPFYADLVSFMSSGPIIAAILEKDNAVEDIRKLIGATDPTKAEPGTIRNKYAKSIDANAVHGSDSDENAEIEGSFFLFQLERFSASLNINPMRPPTRTGVLFFRRPKSSFYRKLDFTDLILVFMPCFLFYISFYKPEQKLKTSNSL